MAGRFPLVLVLFMLCGYCRAQLPAAGLIAYYPFNSNAVDESGFRNHGRLIGNIQRTVDRFGNYCGALKFDGSSGFVSVPNSASLQSPYNAISVAAWIKLEVPANGYSDKWVTLICKGQNPVETISNPAYRFQVFQGNTQSTVSVNTEFTEYDVPYNHHRFEFNRWYFYALVYDGAQVLVYLDGNLVFQFPYMGVLNNNNEPLEIGRDIPGSTEFFSGCMDELRIYNRPLSQSEIQILWNDRTGNNFTNGFTLSMPSNIERETESDKCYTSVFFSKPTAVSTCGNAQVLQVSGQPSGSRFAVGSSPVRFVATNELGRRQSCSFDVIVHDRTKPILTCPADVRATSPSGANEVKVTYTEPTGTDNCPGLKTERILGAASGSQFPAGNSTVTYRSTDASGNVATCSFKVIVTADNTTQPTTPTVAKKDTTVAIANKPADWQLICPAGISRETDAGKCGSVVNYKAPAIEGGTGIITVQTAGLPPGGFFPEGNTLVTWSAKDNAGNSKQCSFKVLVTDVEKPVVTCPDDIVVTIGAGKKDTVITYTPVKAIDNCKVAELKRIDGIESGYSFPVGINTVVYKATDPSGNTKVCSFNVIVKREVKPAEVVNTPNPDLKTLRGEDSVRYATGITKVEDCEVTFLIYDGGLEDNDTVSIIFNGKVLADRVMLHSRKANTLDNIIKITVSLEKGKQNYLIVKAWNTGKTWPNTATVDVYFGKINAESDMRNKKTLRKVIEAVPGVAGGMVFTCEN